jgi:hypothetical protein
VSEPSKFKRGDLVARSVGVGIDIDYGIYLRPDPEPDWHIIWSGVWGLPPFEEMRVWKVVHANREFASKELLAEQERLAAEGDAPDLSGYPGIYQTKYGKDRT